MRANLVVASVALLGPVAAAHAAGPGAAAILQGTPWWVYLVLGLLVWLGLRATRPRLVSLPQD